MGGSEVSQDFILHPDATRVRVLENLQRFLASLPSDKPWKVNISRHVKRRSDAQNAMLWAMYAPIANVMGFDKDDIHQWFCGKFFGWKDVKVPRTPRNQGGVISVPVRTTTRDEDGRHNVIDKATFSQFVDMVERTAAQAGVYADRAFHDERREAA